MSGVKIGIYVVLSAGVSGCTLDSASTTNEELAEASSDIDITATPTCNEVVSFDEAWVPYYNGTPSTADCNMARGDNSPAVRQLQRTLNICYHGQLVENGDFDGATEMALRRTQRMAGTTPDGRYVRETRRVMRHEPTNGGSCVHVAMDFAEGSREPRT